MQFVVHDWYLKIEDVLNKLSNTLYYNTVIPFHFCGYIKCYELLIAVHLKHTICWLCYSG